MFKEHGMLEILDVLRRFKSHKSKSEIQRVSGISRNTIRRYIKLSNRFSKKEPDLSLEDIALKIYRKLYVRERVTISDEMFQFVKHTEQIKIWLKEGLKLTKIHRKLKSVDRSITASYATLRRYAKQALDFGKRNGTVRMPDTSPGEVAEIDFGKLGFIIDSDTGKRRAVHALIITLCYSRHQYVHVTHYQKFEDVVRGLEDAFCYFGGVTRRLIVDNMKTAVLKSDRYEPEFNRMFLEYSNYRGFIIDAARPGEPKDKPKVERQVQYVRNDFFKGETFSSLKDMQEKAVAWCSSIAGLRDHGTTRNKPVVVFENEEKNELLPLEKEKYDPPQWKEASVHPDHCIQFNKSLYSIPDEYVGKKVWVRGDSRIIRVYYKEECIKTHQLVGVGQKSIDYTDYPKEKQGYAMKNCGYYISLAEAVGESSKKFMEELLSGDFPWAHLRQAQKLIRLADKYGALRIEAACRRAVAFKIFNVNTVDKIIKEGFKQMSVDEYISGKIIKPAKFTKPKSYFLKKGDKDADNTRT